MTPEEERRQQEELDRMLMDGLHKHTPPISEGATDPVPKPVSSDWTGSFESGTSIPEGDDASEKKKRVNGKKKQAAAAAPGYFFTLGAVLKPVRDLATVGFEVPEGIRLHINYESREGQVTTEDLPQSAKATGAWKGIEGVIRSGGDWVLIQKNGVARFDARVTIQAKEYKKDDAGNLKGKDIMLIDAVFTGVVDLGAAVPTLVRETNPKNVGDAVYKRYLEDVPEETELPVALSVRFEAAQKPYLRPGEDDSWIAKSRYARQQKNFSDYERLVRGQFVARGHVTLTKEKRWPPESIKLQIFELA